MDSDFLDKINTFGGVSNQYNYTLDIASIVLYLMMIIVYLKRPHIKDRLHRIYIYLFTFSTLTPFFDILSSISVTNRMHPAFVITFTKFYYIGIQGITFVLLIYVLYQLDQYHKISFLKKILLCVPLGFMLLIILSNDFTDFMFSYTREDGYARGNLQFLSYLTALFYFGWTIIFITINRKAYDKYFVLNMWNISFINVGSIILQFIFPNTLIISFGFAISMVLLNLTSHTHNTSIDAHTGMMDRDSLFDIGTKMIYAKAPFTIIMIKLIDYDTLATIYGESYIKNLIRNISIKLRSFVNVGEAFKLTKNAFVLIIRNDDTVENIVTGIEQSFRDYWSIAEQQVHVSYLMTTVKYPDKMHNKDDLVSVISHFETIESNQNGLVPAEELHFRDLVFESKMEKAIRRGLENHYFTVYYQPMWRASDGKFLTAEALIRLEDPEMGFIPPDNFISVAEHCGYIVPIGNYILDQVCDFIEHHDMEKLGLEYIEVNLSVIQCMQKDFIDTVEQIIQKHGISKKYLCFEITETGSTYSNEVFLSNLKKLVGNGHELALDDFGTGYSNLQRMVTTDFKIVKFDKTITQRTCASDLLKDAFTKMIALFHSLSLRVVAEGVETQEQYDFLCGAGIDYIQGFYFSKPVPEEDFVVYLEDHN